VTPYLKIKKKDLAAYIAALAVINKGPKKTSTNPVRYVSISTE
jgi:hypothetical protein